MNNDRELYNILYNKDYFMLNWNEGAVLPENHPHPSFVLNKLKKSNFLLKLGFSF